MTDENRKAARLPHTQRNASGTAGASRSSATPGNRGPPEGPNCRAEDTEDTEDTTLDFSNQTSVNCHMTLGIAILSFKGHKVTIKICQECPDLELNPYLHTIRSKRNTKSIEKQ